MRLGSISTALSSQVYVACIVVPENLRGHAVQFRLGKSSLEPDFNSRTNVVIASRPGTSLIML